MELVERYWNALHVREKSNFLRALEKACDRQPEWWDGKGVSELVMVQNFNELPDDLHGHLIASWENTGFTIDSHNWAQSPHRDLRTGLEVRAYWSSMTRVQRAIILYEDQRTMGPTPPDTQTLIYCERLARTENFEELPTPLRARIRRMFDYETQRFVIT